MDATKRRIVTALAALGLATLCACIGSAPADPDGDAGDTTLVVLAVDGMTCTGCTTRIRAALLALDGVVSADVTLSPAEARVEYLPEEVTTDEMVEAISRLGYEATVL